MHATTAFSRENVWRTGSNQSLVMTDASWCKAVDWLLLQVALENAVDLTSLASGDGFQQLQQMMVDPWYKKVAGLSNVWRFS